MIEITPEFEAIRRAGKRKLSEERFQLLLEEIKRKRNSSYAPPKPTRAALPSVQVCFGPYHHLSRPRPKFYLVDSPDEPTADTRDGDSIGATEASVTSSSGSGSPDHSSPNDTSDPSSAEDIKKPKTNRPLPCSIASEAKDGEAAGKPQAQ
ncbi:hypothetical protein IAT40_001458 [Kwoniella sp. CBS 6097]